MNKLREILRLKYELGISNRQIAVSCHTSHRTVAKYLGLAAQNGLDWSKDKELDDTELECKVLGAGISNPKHKQDGKILPDLAYLHRELKRPNVTLALLQQEYKGIIGNGKNHYGLDRILYTITGGEDIWTRMPVIGMNSMTALEIMRKMEVKRAKA